MLWRRLRQTDGQQPPIFEDIHITNKAIRDLEKQKSYAGSKSQKKKARTGVDELR